MKAVGGYFGLELGNRGEYHSGEVRDMCRLNTSRNALDLILGGRGYKTLYMPFYTCDVLLEPVRRKGVNVRFYDINEALEPVNLPGLKAGEAFLYTNYYGLKEEAVMKLAGLYGDRLIVDNAQAFYAGPIQGIDTFYSARKFFGVSDGAYLYADGITEEGLPQDESWNRMTAQLKRTDKGAEAGYADFQAAEESLCGMLPARMSELTHSILSSVDYSADAERRRRNYKHLDEALHDTNMLSLRLDGNAVPMAYPYLPATDTGIRERLIKEKIFVARYWPNVLVWTKEGSVMHNLACNLLPLPVDQRYGVGDMDRIISIIKN